MADVNSTINLAGLTNPTVTNVPYNSNGTLNKTRFGTVSGVRSPRVMQIMAKFTF